MMDRDELAIDRLAAEYDRAMSWHSLGGMYDPEEAAPLSRGARRPRAHSYDPDSWYDDHMDRSEDFEE